MPAPEVLDEASPAGLAIIDEDGFILFANDAVARCLPGIEPGGNWFDFASTLLRRADGTPATAEEDPVRVSVRGGSPTSLLVRTGDPDTAGSEAMLVAAPVAIGGRRWAVMFIHPKPPAAVRTSRLESLLGELETRNELLQAILRGSTQSIALLDGLDLRVHWANGAFKRMVDLAEDADVDRRRIQELLPDAEETGAADALRDAAESGRPYVAEEQQWRRERGTEYWRWSVTPVQRRDRLAYDLVVMADDVTSDVLARRKVERQARELELVLEHVTNGIAVVDDRRTISLNPAGRAILGLPDDFPQRFTMADLRKQAHFELPDGSAPMPEDSPFLRLLRGEPVNNAEFRLRTADGRERYVSMTGQTVADYGQDAPVVVISIHDITEQRELERRLAEEAEFDRALNRISTAIGATFDVDDILRRVCREAAAAMRACCAFVAAASSGDWVVHAGCGECEALVGQRWTAEEAETLTLSAEARMPIFIEDARAEDVPRLSSLADRGVRSMVAVPFTTRQEVAYVLGVDYGKEPRSFSKQEEDFVDKLAQTVSLSLENARLYTIEHRIAEALQESLLALPEQIQSVDFSYVYRPAKETARVGGDFYDLFEIDGDLLAFLIGDVSGKGIEAAATTSLVKSTLKAHAYEGCSPALILAKSNEVLLRSSAPESFATVFLGLLRRSTGQIVYCGAGHPPALLLAADGSIRPLETRCTVLGALPSASYDDAHAIMLPGDKLVLYTDGIIEARRGKLLFGEQRLTEFVRSLTDTPVWDVPQAVLAEVSEFAEGKLHDDIALLALTLHGAAGEGVAHG